MSWLIKIYHIKIINLNQSLKNSQISILVFIDANNCILIKVKIFLDIIGMSVFNNFNLKN